MFKRIQRAIILHNGGHNHFTSTRIQAATCFRKFIKGAIMPAQSYSTESARLLSLPSREESGGRRKGNENGGGGGGGRE